MSKSKKGNLKVALSFHAAKPNEACPVGALYALDIKGHPIKKIAVAKDNELIMPLDLEGEHALAFGPDVEDFQALDTSSLLKNAPARLLSQLQTKPLLEIPVQIWRRWLWRRVCVSGNVKKCFYFLPNSHRPVFPSPKEDLLSFPHHGNFQKNIGRKSHAAYKLWTPPIITKCLPLCHGVVEVYKRTVCCNIWDLIPKIPELIPDPFPASPFPPPRHIQKQINLAKSIVEPARQTFIAEDTLSDLRTLASLDTNQRKFEFITERPYLVHVLCRYRTVRREKIGETNIGMDGKFTFCHNQFSDNRVFYKRCYTSYYYKVKQWIGGQYVYIYDGEAARAYFSSAAEAALSTFNPFAETCDNYEPPVEGHGERFVLLQSIGNTNTGNLKSPLQASATGIDHSRPIENAGLIDFAGESNCPLAGKLNLLLYIDPDMESIGATYYRFSIAPSDENGKTIGEAQILDQPVTWKKFDNSWPRKTEAVALGPKIKNGEVGLYQIPYVDQWLGNQFHYVLDVAQRVEGNYIYEDGNYNLIVEFFDDAGTRLRPIGASAENAEDIAKDFHYLKFKINSEETEIVPFAALIHNIRINNTKCNAEIVKLGNSPDDCQFIVGDEHSTFSTQFKAYHNEGFMRGYRLTYYKGLNGSDVVLSETPMRPSDFTGLRISDPVLYTEMLNGAKKCTFSLDLNVIAKHTNGSSFISEYNADDKASFALEVGD